MAQWNPLNPAITKEELIGVLNTFMPGMLNRGITQENIAPGAIVGGSSGDGDPIPIAQETIEGVNVKPETLPEDRLHPDLQTLIDDASTNAAAALVVAVGKNTYYFQNEMPTGGDYAENDVWCDLDGGRQMYYYTSGAWTAIQFGTQAIAAGSVSAAQMVAGTITAASGVIHDIDASKITTGILSAITISACILSAVQGTFADLVAGVAGAQRLHMGFNAANKPFFIMYDEDNNPGTSIDIDSFNLSSGSFAPFNVGGYTGGGIFVE